MSGFSISEYHSTTEIYEKHDRRMSLSIHGINRDAMNEYLQYFENVERPAT